MYAGHRLTIFGHRTHGGIFIYKACNGQSFLLCVAEITVEQLQKNPLCPFIKLWITGTYLSVPVIAKSNFIQLPFKGGNIIFSSCCRVLACFNGILFCRQTKTIKAHRMQHIKAFQSFIAAVNITGNISQRMAHM